VSIEMIIARSGLSTGAVYRYFKGKDQIISAAFGDATREIGEVTGAVLDRSESASPSELLEALLAALNAYAYSGVGAAKDIDRMPVAVHGWSFAQTDPELKAALAFVVEAFRQRCTPLIERWREDGTVAPDADAGAVAEVILSLCMGYVVQHSLGVTVDAKAHAEGLRVLAGTT
jgi:AcrR family transcriptional regulator